MSLGGIGNLDYTVLLCRRMAQTRAFYRDVMKFPVETDQPNWVSFRVGAALLTLRPRGKGSVCDDGAAVPGATGQTLIPLQNGHYSVRAGFGAPCNLNSAAVAVLNTGIGIPGLDASRIYPQPADDRLWLRMENGAPAAMTIELFDALGRNVRTVRWERGEEELSVPVGDLAPGSYVLRAQDHLGGSLVHAVMVAH